MFVASPTLAQPSRCPEESAPERCNGEDDDCDGRSDEGLGLGTPCITGTGACEEPGVVVCDGRGGTVCGGGSLQPTPEVCNGIDDDCDGARDDGLGLGGPCETGEGACAAPGIVVCGEGGATRCDGIPGLPGPERCNTLDDDCDGLTDEGLGLGQACFVGAGACEREGAIACDGQGGTVCAGEPGVPEAETCNGIDDDCDGARDDGFALDTPCTVGQGLCTAQGIIACDGLGGAACDAAPGVGVPEQCNQLDDDCDGAVDEDFALGEACSSGVGACTAPGTWVCAADGGMACNGVPGVPAAETCDFMDEDCDGHTDEGLGVGEACAVGLGICATEGHLACAADGSTTCVAIEPVPPLAELCNELDDDCDGSTDEDFHLGAECTVNGLVGTVVCAADGTAACLARCTPEPERCNGLDEDCDGHIDEDGPRTRYGVRDAHRRRGGLVLSGLPDGRGGRRVAYDFAEDGFLTLDGATARLRSTVVLDGGGCGRAPGEERWTLDVELRLRGIGPQHGAGPGSQARRAQEWTHFDWIGGRLTRGPEVVHLLPGDWPFRLGEGANEVDRGLGATGWFTFPMGDGDHRGRGELHVDLHLVEDCPEFCPGGPAPETCDGSDEDCDGLVDESFLVGEPCSEGVGACATEGYFACAGDGIFCDARPGQPRRERCNDIDDDCDGRVDEEHHGRHRHRRACDHHR